ncbi:DHA2 family efflux MFS transporter permease subunit [Actinophytocola algeriensis]|uniref:EmrB/QacA subfamily drug resistance transporter n=1 Tax=Actinophytocola algeriensis TaxID=1768010 RepID=A0A7W7Q0J0_9PSEU|nr:DHA2 family efflux MFS transporter permease subunit [Actinophytocola algeriensis]MBB4904720.1 EmrB/QacA subfamily drug resistance transporter [Actinophytocola algeriensis]MBE1476421.1 EmrB/QacA subfamily drug resistance transporter [Actinophytocola algeriensis]
MTEVLPPTPSAAGGAGSDKLDRRILAIGSVVVLGAIMAMLDITVVNVAIDHLIGEFNTTLNTIQWVATGYTLALATVIPLSGWAADRFGTKRIYLIAVFLFMVGSALAGMAWSVESLILFRVLQGLGGGMLMPLGMTILTKAAGPDRIGRVMSVIGVPMLLGPIVGPILGGWLVDDVSWRWIFFINVPVGIVTLLLGMKILEKDEPRPAEKLDVLGLLLLSPGLAALIYGLAQVPAHEGVGHPEVYLPAGVGAVLVATFIWHASRTEGALIDLKLFRDRGFGIAAVTMILFTVAFFGAMLLLPLYFQQVRGEGALAAGLLVAPQGIGAMLMMPIAGLIVDRIGSARIAQLGIVVIVGSMVLFTQLEGDTTYMAIGAALFVMGIGMGMTMMPIMSAALKTLRQKDVARASTSLNIIQQVAASIGTALLSVLLFNEVKEKLAPLAANAPAGTPAPDVATTSIGDLPEPVRSQIADLMSEAYSSTFLWALVLLAVAFVPALFLPRGKTVSPAPEPPADVLPEGAEAPPVIDEPAR